MCLEQSHGAEEEINLHLVFLGQASCKFKIENRDGVCQYRRNRGRPFIINQGIAAASFSRRDLENQSEEYDQRHSVIKLTFGKIYLGHRHWEWEVEYFIRNVKAIYRLCLFYSQMTAFDMEYGGRYRQPVSSTKYKQN